LEVTIVEASTPPPGMPRLDDQRDRLEGELGGPLSTEVVEHEQLSIDQVPDLLRLATREPFALLLEERTDVVELDVGPAVADLDVVAEPRLDHREREPGLARADGPVNVDSVPVAILGSVEEQPLARRLQRTPTSNVLRRERVECPLPHAGCDPF
jgi:hypothetical protein